jgi:tRNA-binding protein
MDNTLTWSEFERVEMRVGTIEHAEVFAAAKKLSYILNIHFGPLIGNRRSSAQITKRYQPHDLVGRQVVAVVNFPKKQIANIMSECLVLGAMGEEGDIVLLNTDFPVENGLRIG